MDTRGAAEMFRFGRFCLASCGGGLFRCGDDGALAPVVVGSRALAILALLAERQGEIVSKNAIMASVWPDTVVEEANLTVQVSALRRVLDAGRDGPSCIQTIPGRGYRLADTGSGSTDAIEPGASPAPQAGPAEVDAEPATCDSVPRQPRVLSRMRIAGGLVKHALLISILLAVSAATIWWLVRARPGPATSELATTGRLVPSVDAPLGSRLSLMVLPFANIDHVAELDRVATDLSEDLTTYLARYPMLNLPARSTAAAHLQQPVDVKRLGGELGVRYALEGSLRLLDGAVLVTAHLVSTESGRELWADQFEAAVGSGSGRNKAAPRLSTSVIRQLIDIESARGALERPGNPDAADLLLQAYSMFNRPLSSRTQPEVVALFERAVQMNTSSVEALAGLAGALLDELGGSDNPEAPARFERVEGLLRTAEMLQPRHAGVMQTRMYFLRVQERWPEAVAAIQQFNDAYPASSNGYYQLGTCLLFMGRAGDAIPALEESLRLDPSDPALWGRFRRLGQAALILDRYDEAIAWAQRALAARPGAAPEERASRVIEIAAAHASAGRLDQARAAAAEAVRLWPYLTARGWWGADVNDAGFAGQLARVGEALRHAGLRDHEDEDADFGVPADADLHLPDTARTPTTTPGVRTIRTVELANLLGQQKVVVLDLSAERLSVPGAIVLRGAGTADAAPDGLRARLDSKMRELTRGDDGTPVVTMAWNSDHFSGRNLALRLVTLGYSHVLWYRGGRESWEAAEQPEAPISVQDW